MPRIAAASYTCKQCFFHSSVSSLQISMLLSHWLIQLSFLAQAFVIPHRLPNAQLRILQLV